MNIVNPPLIVLSALDISGDNFKRQSQGQPPSFTDDAFEARMEK